jgi:glyoxylase-like metal-dependent hydrolase (beta-lactamase superfamily II)
MEFPYLNGTSSYPPPDPMVGGGAMPFTSPVYPRGPIRIQDQLRPLNEEDGSITELPGWRWIHTPGHTPGHVSLFRDDDRTLIAGDAFITTRQESFFSVATQRPEMTGPPAYFTSDWEAARLSVQRLAGLFPTTMATGHGLPVAGQEALDALQTLAETFDERAVPSSGRYVRSPAVADERGVRSVPPLPAANKAARIATGAAVGAMVWMVWSRRARRATWS